ncbi:MAG TPA: helical backbone metal receptor [Acidimicrobiales bacterium]|nr:helical backbone metal receptor [Acidimicrobiales bacterium]
MFANLRRAALAATCLVPLALAGACSSTSSAGTGSTVAAGGFPVTLHASNGVVQVPKRPTAVISLSPTATEMLYAMGAGHQVKAVDNDSNYPPGVPMTQLSGVTPNVEAILAYQPDLVVTAQDTTGLTGHLAAAGVPVLALPAASTLDDAYAQIRMLGAATGNVGGAQAEVSSMQAKIHQVLAGTHVPAHTTYYYELDPTYYSATSSTFIGQVLGLLGLHDIADAAGGAGSQYPQLSGESIIAADPSYIFLADTKCCGATPQTVAARPGWDTIAAVRLGHVVNLDDDVASRWGPRIAELLAQVAAAVNGSSTG